MPKTIKTRSGRVLILNTAKENAAINAGIAADPDTHELTDAEFAQLRARGRPLGSGSKMQVTLRLDIDVVEKLKAEGAGWQTRANAVLRRSVMRSGKTAHTA
jgi:uncharacterized protein (DUF4415 family)